MTSSSEATPLLRDTVSVLQRNGSAVLVSGLDTPPADNQKKKKKSQKSSKKPVVDRVQLRDQGNDDANAKDDEEDDDDDSSTLSGGSNSSSNSSGGNRPGGNGSRLARSVWQYKAIALVCSCLLSVGSHFAVNMLSSLKTTLKEELEINNLQYSLITSASSLMNTVVPFFGGMFIDVFGTAWGALLASTLVMLGEVVTAVSTTGSVQSYPLMLLGRIVFGLGEGCIVTVQEAILAHWFRGRSLGIVIGLQLALSRLANFLAVSTVVPIIEASGGSGSGPAFWVSAGVCAFSWLVMLVYTALLRLVIQRDDGGSDAELTQRLASKHRISFGALVRFSNTYWLIGLCSFMFGLMWAPFQRISAELVTYRFGVDEEDAGWYASLALAVPIVLNPVLGMVISRWGKRTYILNTSAVLLSLCFVLVGFTCANPAAALVLYSFSLAMGPIAMITAIPLVVPLAYTGTALGIYACASNIATTIMEPVQGQVQDDNGGSYQQVMVIFTVVAVATVLVAALLSIVSVFHHAGLLDAPTGAVSTKRPQEQQGNGLVITHVIAGKGTRRRRGALVWIAFFLAALVVAWVLYIYFLVTSTIDSNGNGSGGSQSGSDPAQPQVECPLS